MVAHRLDHREIFQGDACLHEELQQEHGGRGRRLRLGRRPGRLHIRRHGARLPHGAGRRLPLAHGREMVRDDGIRPSIPQELEIPEDVQQEVAGVSKQRRPRKIAQVMMFCFIEKVRSESIVVFFRSKLVAPSLGRHMN